MNEDTKALVEAINNLLEDENCTLDYERALLLRQAVADVEAKWMLRRALTDVEAKHVDEKWPISS